MVKGVTRRVIVLKSQKMHLFDEAIFIVKEDVLREGGVTGDEIVKQAQEVASKYVRQNINHSWLSKIPAPVFAAFGAAFTAIIWLVTLML